MTTLERITDLGEVDGAVAEVAVAPPAGMPADPQVTAAAAVPYAVGRAARARSVPTPTCPATGKHGFPNRRAVRRALREVAEARRIAADVLGDPNAGQRQAYSGGRCAGCHQWHLTSTPAP